jgi:RNA polymerase sigma-70 factor (ECF subfamily)
VQPSPEETFLVLRAQSDDREALEALLRRVQPALRRYVASLVGSQDADDVLQDGLIQVCRKLRWLERPESFRAWTFRICSRFAFRHLRRTRKIANITAEESRLDEAEAVTPRWVDVDGERLDELLSHDALSPASRAVLLLHFREEMPLAEIAAVLEIPLGTVKSRLAFGLKTLRARSGRS